MVFFALSLTMAFAMSIADWMHWSLPGGNLQPVFWHLLLVGWITQIIFGVSLWMFPKNSRERPLGPPWLGWTVYVLLTAGLILRVVLEPFPGVRGMYIAGLVISAGLQWLAGIGYILLIWPRIRGKRRKS